MNQRSAQVILGISCFVFGVLLMIQFRTQGTIAKTLQAESSADQAQIISNLYDANLTLRKEVAALEKQLGEHESGRSAVHVDEMVADLQKFRIVNGSAQAVGPGVRLQIAADIRPEDVQDLINELRNAGAEAVALNGERITARTAVTQERGAVVLNGRKLLPPFVFDAVGASDILERALTRKGGLVSYLQTTYPEGQIAVEKSQRLVLPAAAAPLAYQLAQPERRS